MGQRITDAIADGLEFIPLRGRALIEGFYVARKKAWSADYGWRVVYVAEMDDGERMRLGVYQVASDEPENPRQWVFRSRLMGLEQLPASLPPHPRVQLAEIVH